jgi:multiple sugar transport system permease protein/raffinose/stachyose/melibiose transport system permease protein
MKRSKIKYDLIAYLFITPNYLIYLIFILVPVLWVLNLSFTRYELVTPPVFIGITNYLELFQDEDFLQALQNTFVYWIFTVALSMAIGLVLAVVLNQKIKGVSFFRAAYYLPNVISMVAIAIMWIWIYDPAKGILNAILGIFGMPPSDWLMNQDLALGCIIVPSIWALLGFNMVIYLAGLQNIPNILYEAATVDGASALRQFFVITIPMLRPITFFLFVMSSIKSFQVFDQIYVMTRGGPAKATTTLAFEIYENGFQFYKMGYASAMSVVLLVIVAVITFINFAYGGQGYGAQMR